MTDQITISKYFSVITRHRPYHNGHHSKYFPTDLPSWDRVDGWVNVLEVIHLDYRSRGREAVDEWLKDKDFDYIVYVMTMIQRIRDRSGASKGRLQLKLLDDGTIRTLWIRATNGHSAPGIIGIESLFKRVPAFGEPGSPRYVIHGTYWNRLDGIFTNGLSSNCQHTGEGAAGSLFTYRPFYHEMDAYVLVPGTTPRSSCS